MSDSTSRHRVLSVSTIFPSMARPSEGVFVHKRQSNLPSEFAVEIARMRPTFPLINWLRPHLRDDIAARESFDGLLVHDLRFFYTPKLLKKYDGDHLARRLLRFLREGTREYDILDGHFAFPAGYGAVKAARAIDKPSVITLRGTMPGYLLDDRRGKIVQALQQADALISVSASLADAARAAVGEDLEIEVIGNGVDTRRFCGGDQQEACERLGWANRGPVLLTVGGLVPRKGAHRVVKALPALLEKHPDLRYVVVGSSGVEGGFEGALRDLIRELGVEEAVELVGSKGPDELPDYYRAADLFVLATSNEGWANVIQEALASGTPTVATDVGGNREVMGGETQGIVVPFGDEAALSKALLDALDTAYDREAIAAWGGRRDWKEVGREVAAVYRRLL